MVMRNITEFVSNGRKMTELQNAKATIKLTILIKICSPLRYPLKIVPHTTLPTTILLFQNLFSSKINSQSPILPYLRQRSRSTKSKIAPHTTLPTTIPLFQNLLSLSNHNLLIFISIPCTFYFLSVLILHNYLSVLFFFKNSIFRKLFIF